MSRFDEKSTGLVNSIDLQKPRVRIVYWVAFLVVMVVSLVSILPPIWIMISSLKDIKEYFQIPPTIIPKTFHFEKLTETWNLLKFWKYYINSLEICAGAVVFSVFFNGLLGYVLSRLKPKGSSIVFMLIMWTMLMPNTVSMVPLFKNFVKFPLIHVNMTNSFWPLWFIAGANAFYVIVFKGFFDGIPTSLIEASKLDGCNNLGIFFKIVLPLSKPVIIVTSIFTINNTWGDFFWSYLVLKDTNKYPVMVKIFTMIGAAGVSQDIVVVALIFAIIPPVLIFIFFQKYIMQGFTLSGIKG